ncbi:TRANSCRIPTIONAL ADAPTER 1 [Salix koriyanagi]|uniref:TRANSCRIPTIONAL ADAPTER 1 n=1 Tax=Salix koriyanagi TaxID=2511006 RepID=A0A9Q0X4R7_9ROSI|nr:TRANSCRIPTIONAL ADAPTER 1 [Salix koriyanagi]KAJ6777280.1 TRANSCRIPTIONAL ADAPTER 1 [Salix koriyanagi]
MLAVQKFYHPKVLEEWEVTSLLLMQMDTRKTVSNCFMGMPFLLPHAREGHLSVEIAGLRTTQVPPGPLGKPHGVACEELNAGAQEQQSATELLSLGSRPPVEVASVEEGEEVEQMAGSPFVQSRSPVTAPLGISMNYSGSRKALSNASLSSNYLKGTCLRTGKLPDSRSLRHWLEQKLQMESISMSLDSVNLLNNGLDAYLKRLIEPCMALAGSRHGNEYLKRASGQFIPGLNGALPGKYIHRETESVCASMLDFRVAMESNPQILGDDWPTQLEKISLHGFEE